MLTIKERGYDKHIRTVRIFRLKKDLLETINNYLFPLIGRKPTSKEMKVINDLIYKYSGYTIPKRGKSFEKEPYGYMFYNQDWFIFKERLVLMYEDEIRKHDDQLDADLFIVH
jgi:hypothetical protein